MTNLQHLIFSRFIAISCIILICLSCKKDEKEYYPELVFPVDTYYVSQGADLRVYIQQGNGVYDITTADADILEFKKDEQFWPAGAITIKGLKKGSTTLTVNDIGNNKSVALTVYVVDPFLMLQIGSPIPQFKWKEGVIQNEDKANEIRNEILKFNNFEPQNILILKSGTSTEYLLFKDINHIQPSHAIGEGSFVFSTNLSSEPLLTLTDKQTKKQKKLPLYFYQNRAPDLLFNFLNFPSKSVRELTASTGAVKLSTSVVEPIENKFLYFQDISAQIKDKYPEVDTAELYQDVTIIKDFHNQGVKIGPGILTL